MAKRNKPRRSSYGVGKPTARPRKSSSRGPSYRRRSRYSRHSQRNGVLVVVVAVFVAIAGIAIANAFTGRTTTLSGATVDEQPTSTPTPASPTPTHSPTRATPRPTQTTVATASASPAPAKSTPAAQHSAEPVASPRHHSTAPSKPTTKRTKACPTASTRLARARAALQHPSALPDVSVVTAGSREGTLGTADLASRTVSLYLRSCAEEPTSKLAIVWMYEAGQFIDVDSWDTATRDRWRQLRGADLTSSSALLQDAAAVYTYWQTGSTESWQSPVAPPSPSRLGQLVPFLHFT